MGVHRIRKGDTIEKIVDRAYKPLVITHVLVNLPKILSHVVQGLCLCLKGRFLPLREH
jgi:hypothetical protein